MSEILNSLIVIASTLLAIIVLGIAAGFSPTLYVAQITVTLKTKKAMPYVVALMSGVLIAIILLIVLFQVVHLETLLDFIHTTVRAVVVTVASNLFIGMGFIIGGVWYLRSSPKPESDNSKVSRTGGASAILGLGFVRTFTGIGSVTATFVAGNIIARVSDTILYSLLYTIVFLIATILPFIVILLIVRKNPKTLNKLTGRFKALLSRVNYRLILGITAIVAGGSIAAFNIVAALLHQF